MNESPIICKLCGKPIDDPRNAWREAVGWVTPRGAKGMTGERKTGQLAHPECITRMRAGFSPEQDSIL